MFLITTTNETYVSLFDQDRFMLKMRSICSKLALNHLDVALGMPENYFMTFLLFNELSKEDKKQLPELISSSVGNPTQERLKMILESYSTEKRRVLLVAKTAQQLIGCIGLDRGEDRSLAILHIAVSNKFQRQGIGKALLDESIRKYSPITVIAETDDDAIGFYTKSDFQIFETFANEWNVRRYRVRRSLIT